jgi:opacity protein-like surface antigen
MKNELLVWGKKGSEKMNASRGVWTGILLLATVAGLIRAEILTIQARGSYFNPTDQVFRDIYGNGMSWGGELGFRLTKRIAIWAGGDYFSKIGKLNFTEEETKVRIAPLTVGAKYYLALGRLMPYAGAGLGYFQYKETNSIGTVEKGDIGFVVRTGLVFKLGAPFFMDVQGTWSTCSVQPLGVQANLGGFSAGVGLGLEF